MTCAANKIPLEIEEDTQTILSIKETGLEHLIQLEICDLESNLYFVITWDLIKNQQHSLYQGTFMEGKLPTNYLISKYEKEAENAMSCVFDGGAIVDL